MICVIDCGTGYIDELRQALSGLGQDTAVIRMEDIRDSDLESFSKVIISGSPILLTETDIQEYIDKFSFLGSISIPVLGICFGHQIIGLVHGSDISIGKNISRMERIEIVREDSLFEGIEDRTRFREDHREFISLPHDFILLAESSSCPTEAMKHKEKNLYGVQFHPEASGEEGRKLLNNFIRLSWI